MVPPHPSRRAPAAVLALTCLFASAGCGTDEGDPPLDDAECLVGTGSTSFEELTDGAELEVHAGAQGGYHVFLCLRAKGVIPGDPLYYREENPMVDFDVRVDGVEIDITDAMPLGMAPVGDDWYEVVGRAVILENEHVVPYDEFGGTELEVSATAVDDEGRTCTATRVVTAAVSPDDPEELW